MTDERERRAREIQEAALAVAADDRRDFIRSRCGDDGDLLRRVMALFDGRTRHDVSDEERAAASDGAPTSGAVIEDRYELETLLGQGAFGSVYRAADVLTGEAVAIKFIPRPTDRALADWRREVATLRRLHFPGVVGLRDDGLLADLAFIVMDLVDGAPFPGGESAVTWEAIEPACLSALEALDRLHWAGLVHRDLKPDNLLVDADGQPTIVDLGIAWDEGFDVHDAAGRKVAGTPAYIAPELLRGGAPSAASDLYAVGVMLFELLGGKPPHPLDTLAGLLHARTNEVAPSLGSLAPAVPAHVADTVDRLLDRRPEGRPRSAGATAAMLRGHRPRTRAVHDLPYLGGREVVDALVAEAKAGRSLNIHGPRRSGRTRTLLEAAKTLMAEGVRVRRTVDGKEPLWSLRAVLGESADDVESSSGERRAIDVLGEQLGSGEVLVIDDLERIDAASRRVVEGARARGSVLSASRTATFDESLLLKPVSEEALRALFAGPDRILHLREDAAHALWIRTAGLPGRVEDELDAWIRAGLARSEEDLVVVERAAVGQLEVDSSVLAPMEDPGDVPLDAERNDRLSRIEFCGAMAETEMIAAALDTTPADAAETLANMERDGDVVQAGPGWILVSRPRRDPMRFTAEFLRALHETLADHLPAGDPRRLHHLVAAGLPLGVAREACATAEGLLDRGRAGRAFAVLSHALAATRSREAPDLEAMDELVLQMLRAALSLYSRAAVESVLYQLGRIEERTPVVETVETLARAAANGFLGNAPRALRSLEHDVKTSDGRLQRWRHSIRLVVSQSVGNEALRDALLQLHRWRRTDGSSEGRRLLASWLGWWRYRQLRFRGAARMHRLAARLADNAVNRLTSLTDAAIAALDGFQFDDAVELAATCLDSAAAMRSVHGEVRAEWILCSARYRRGDVLEVDSDLIDAVARLGVPRIEALVLQNQSALAWRNGDPERTRELANRGARLAAGAGDKSVSMTLRALALFAGDEPEPGEAGALLESARACPIPGLAAQGAALLAGSGHGEAAALAAIVHEAAGTLPSELHDCRREILSMNEALELVD